MENQDYTLLVVDDNEMNRDMLSRRLARKGYQVKVAEDGEKALEIVAREAIDLVLLDIMMPGIDGVEVLKILRRDHSQTELPVIMATAKADSKDMVEALDHGANDYVIKPLEFKVVLARVQKELRTKQAATAPKGGEPTVGEIEPGVVLAKRYRLEKRIGKGTFGAVYRAIHIELDSPVAVKILLPSVTANEESLARFRQEGIAACRVKHPAAVAVSDFGVTETGVAYLVMELLEGEPLIDEITRSKKLSPQRCLEIIEPVCDVLAAAHDTGLVHRDIKPENVFLHRTSRGEQVKVCDFGIAKLVGEAVIQENLTAEGWVLGTPAYMAPERISSRDLDGKADVYSLGVMLFEMLAGQRPFLAKNRDPMSMIMMHVNDPSPTLRSVDLDAAASLEAVVGAAMQKDPTDRPEARELAAALRQAVAELDRPEPPVETPIQPSRSKVDHDAETVAFHSQPQPSQEPRPSRGSQSGLESPAAAESESFLSRWLKRLWR